MFDETSAIGSSGAPPAPPQTAPRINYGKRAGETISDPTEMAQHLSTLPKPLPARLFREPDWQSVRALIRIDRRVALDVLLKRIRYTANEGAIDESWIGASLIVAYSAHGQQWSYRTVIRDIARGGFIADAPVELRQGPLSMPGGSWLALPTPAVSESAPVEQPRRHPLKAVNDLPTQMAFMSMLGGDLQLRSGRCTEINHPARVRDLLERLELTPSLLLTAAGDHGACEAALEKNHGRLPVLTIRCHHRSQLPLRKGRVVFLTGMLGQEQYTLKSVVLKVEGDRAALRKPKEIFRLQRRRRTRYEIRTPAFSVSLWDGLNMYPVEGVVDLSEEGLGVLLSPDTPAQVGDVYKLVLAMGKKQTMGVTGICVSCNESGWHFRRCGFEFVDLDERTRRVIQHWLERFGHSSTR